MYWSMSPCTKRLQRSTRSFAPFSGVLFHCCALASLTPDHRAHRRARGEPGRCLQKFAALELTHALSSLMDAEHVEVHRWLVAASCSEPRAGRRVEQVRARKIGHEADAIAGAAIDAIADERRDLLPVEAAEELRIGAGRLDDDDVGGQAVAVRPARNARAACRRAPAGRRLRRALARHRQAARRRRTRRLARRRRCARCPARRFIAGEPMKPATNVFDRRVVELERIARSARRCRRASRRCGRPSSSPRSGRA